MYVTSFSSVLNVTPVIHLIMCPSKFEELVDSSFYLSLQLTLVFFLSYTALCVNENGPSSFYAIIIRQLKNGPI